jgi:hypothetical protein
MNHQSAIDSQAASRYALDDLTETERDAFEEHYFDCTVCSEDVRTLETLRLGVRQLALNPKPVRSWWRPVIALPWAATVAMASYLGFQTIVTIPNLAGQVAMLSAQMGAMTGVITEHLNFQSAARAGGEPEQVVRAGRAVEMNLEIVHGDNSQYTGYRAVTRRRNGAVIQSDPISVEQTSNSILVALRPLPAGRYETVVEGVRKDGNRPTITTYPFVVTGF